jgi:hypothetical protein
LAVAEVVQVLDEVPVAEVLQVVVVEEEDLVLQVVVEEAVVAVDVVDVMAVVEEGKNKYFSVVRGDNLIFFFLFSLVAVVVEEAVDEVEAVEGKK